MDLRPVGLQAILRRRAFNRRALDQRHAILPSPIPQPDRPRQPGRPKQIRVHLPAALEPVDAVQYGQLATAQLALEEHELQLLGRGNPQNPRD